MNALAASTRQDDEIDAVTLARAQRGDHAAMHTLIECYQARVFALISRFVGHGSAAVEDIAQETFLSVLRSLKKFSPLGEAKLSTWILTIASRRSLDWLRKQKPVAPLGEVAAPTTTMPTASLAHRIEAAIKMLEPGQRAAFVLFELEGFSYDEIARTLSVEIGTIKSRLSRARRKLRAALAEEENQ